MGMMDLTRAREQLALAGLDAMLLLSPRHFFYATGHASWFVNLYASPGYGAAIVPVEAGQAPGVLVSDVEESAVRALAPEFALVATYPVWIAYATVPDSTNGAVLQELSRHSRRQPATRQSQVDLSQAVAQLIELIRTMGLQTARIGIELDFAQGAVLEQLRAALPAAKFVDALPLLRDLRSVKSAAEVALLRRGTQLAEGAIAAVTSAIEPGMTAGEIARRYRAAVFAHDASRGDVLSARITLRVGPHVLDPEAAGSYAVRRGDMIFMDCGVEVAGYWADMGRCFVLGRAATQQRQIYAALRSGFLAATEQLHAGNDTQQVFDAGMAAVRAAGMTSYVRGNVGHGVGLDRAPEYPILGRDHVQHLAAGNVISVEFPYYIHGVGAFQLEDTFHLQPDGREVFNRLSHELVELG